MTIYTSNVAHKNCRKRGKKDIPRIYHGISNFNGGWGGIRTPGGVAPTTVFKTAAFDRSATHPKLFLPTVFQPTVLFARLADSYARPPLLPRSATHPKLSYKPALYYILCFIFSQGFYSFFYNRIY